jgi:hypothetical protein
MNKAKQKNLMEQLLDQELPLTDEQYLAYRRRVTDGIRKVQREEKTMRILTKSAWGVTGLVFVVASIIDFNRDSIPDLVRLSSISAVMVCLACATALLTFYLINYRPRLRNAEHQATLLSLQRQLHELRLQMPQDPDPPSGAQGTDALPNP